MAGFEVGSVLKGVRDFVVQQGGDGDGWVLSDNWREYADKFEWCENEYWDEQPRFERNPERADAEGPFIAFSHDQEAIYFAPRNFDPKFSDITVVLW